MPSFLMLRTGNWQTIHQLIGPLRELGIPAAAVVDFETIASGPGQWPNLLRVACPDAQERQQLEAKRARCAEHLRRSSADYKKGGLSALTEPIRGGVKQFLDELALYGIF